MAGKLQFTLEQYQEAAHKWRKDLLMLPIIGIEETLKFMTGRPGIRYKESVAMLNGNAQFFSECYGVVIGDGTDAVNVRLRAYGRERFSIQDVPIIPSQVVVKTGPDYVDVQMRIKPTADFKAFLASKGEWLIVLSPQSLADEVVQVLKDALKKYELFART